MKSRKTIEDTAKDMASVLDPTKDISVALLTAVRSKLILEVVLDIRDLLMKKG